MLLSWGIFCETDRYSACLWEAKLKLLHLPNKCIIWWRIYDQRRRWERAAEVIWGIFDLAIGPARQLLPFLTFGFPPTVVRAEEGGRRWVTEAFLCRYWTMSEEKSLFFPKRIERQTQFGGSWCIDKSLSFSGPCCIKAEATNGPHWLERLQLSLIQNRFYLAMNKSNESGTTDYVKARPSFSLYSSLWWGHTRLVMLLCWKLWLNL